MRVLNRRADLLKYVNKDQQVLFTTTDLSFFAPDFVEGSDIWDVKGGVVQQKSKSR